MTVLLKHKFQSVIPDATDTGWVRPSNWNDNHDLTGTANTFLKFDSLGNGVSSSITVDDSGNTVFPPTLTISGTILDTKNALLVTATMPAVMTVSPQDAVKLAITGAGSSAKNSNALNIGYGPGYTGPNVNRGIQAINSNASTGNILIPPAESTGATGALGIFGFSIASGTGLNLGVGGSAQLAPLNVGVLGLAQISLSSATNIGVVGSAINNGSSPVMIGGWFSLNQTTVPSVSAALIADNALQAAPIILAQVAGTTKWQIEQHGLPVHSAFIISGLPTGVAGMTAYITDGDAGLAWGATAVNSGSGATKYLVWYNGANWTVAGK